MNRNTLAALFAALLLPALLRGNDDALLQPPRHVGAPDGERSVTNRAFQGIPSLAVAPGGRLWANWYAGVTPNEDQNNYVVVTTSGDGGRTWTEVLVIDPDGPGPLRAFDPELWVTPDHRLVVFWAQSRGHDGTVAGVWCVETTQPDAERPAWSRPRRLTDGIMMCKPLVLSSGEWALPASTWRETDRSARMIVSTDQGRTWDLRGGCNVPAADRAFDEHLFVERGDGTLWLLARTKYGIGGSVSTDRGRTWPALTPSAIQHPSARFFISRLASGHLLLVKHGPVATKTGRERLSAFISVDDGATWNGGLVLDERPGVSYPDGQQAPDGIIRIVYDYNRTTDRQILLASFREEDAAAGRAVTADVRLRQVVSKASGGREKPAASPPRPVAPAGGIPLRTSTPGALSGAGVAPLPLVTGARLYADRNYVAGGLPATLQGMHFLPVAMDGVKTVTCGRAGTVWFLTPAPDRNRDSQTRALLDQGFAPVALPEVPLFLPDQAANFCTLYQKDCAADEAITIGKWATPVFLP